MCNRVTDEFGHIGLCMYVCMLVYESKKLVVWGLYIPLEDLLLIMSVICCLFFESKHLQCGTSSKLY